MKLALALLLSSASAIAGPMRPLPGPSARALAAGPGLYVAPTGSDTANGSKQAPWKTIGRALTSLKAGDTLYLRAGTYHESVKLTKGGTAAAPITLRSAPNEIAIIDAGIAEFSESPAKAWEPTTTANEYRSTATYQASAVSGNFADTMIPLHPYKFVEDLRATNVAWNVENDQPGGGIYLGPGVWLDPVTHRIHARLTPIKLAGWPDYAGPTDPRRFPLVIGLDRPALAVDNAAHVRLQDLVLRGSSGHTLHLDRASNIELDRVTVYGGAPAIYAKSTSHLKLTNSAIRGTAAPWSSRPSMKYRGSAPYLVVVDSAQPQSADWELASSEFTDGHDGIVVDSIKQLRFHNNRVDNFNDDALYLTLTPRGSVPEDVQIYENVFSRAFTVLAFGERGSPSPSPVGSGVYLYRNIFDLRDVTARQIPRDTSGAPQGQGSDSRMCGDHGNPTWEPMFFYQNTVITRGKVFRNYYGAGMAQRTTNTKRRLFNNMFVQLTDEPGLKFDGGDLQVDGNLLWSVGAAARADFFAKFRASKVFTQSKTTYAPGWGASDIYGDPRLKALGPSGPLDPRLQPGSLAIDAGVAVPVAWPDSLRKLDVGKPDIGALPANTPMFQVGFRR